MRWTVLPLLLTACSPGSTTTDETADTAGDATSTDCTPTPWSDEGPFDIGRGNLADNQVLPTLDGNVRLKQLWTGCDVMMFLPDQDESAQRFGVSLWEDDHQRLLTETPRNTHWFFFTDAADAEDRAKAHRKAFRAAAKRTGDDALLDFVNERMHFVTSDIDLVEGWVRDHFDLTGYGFAVGHDQRIRDVGALADPDRFSQAQGWFGPNMAYAVNEARYLNFVAARAKQMAAETDVTVVTVLDAEDVGGATVDVELPDAATMAGFDTLEVDVEQLCGGDREFGTCAEWDYLAYLDHCGIPTEENGGTDEACQQRVPAVAAQDAVMGLCAEDGVAGTDPCEDADDCAPAAEGVAVTCEGYQPAVEAADEIPADTRECSCAEPDGTAADKVQTCRNDGTGFGACPCDCVEVARWITTYHREGRWVWDNTHALGTLGAGGTQRLRYRGGNRYIASVDLRLSNQGKDWGTPSERIPLFTGGRFGEDYNDKYDPQQIAIPADAKHVELVAIISGHGFGQDQANCAEFCNHTHHFTVDDTEFVKDHPNADRPLGCVEQVSEGTVPNQFGTWFFGRGGWCPGKEVVPYVEDLDAVATPGSTVTVRYEGKLDGEPYVPMPVDGGSGFGGRIDMNSWLVVWR